MCGSSLVPKGPGYEASAAGDAFVTVDSVNNCNDAIHTHVLCRLQQLVSYYRNFVTSMQVPKHNYCIQCSTLLTLIYYCIG